MEREKKTAKKKNKSPPVLKRRASQLSNNAVSIFSQTLMFWTVSTSSVSMRLLQPITSVAKITAILRSIFSTGMENPKNALLFELSAILKYSGVSLLHFIRKSTGKVRVYTVGIKWCGPFSTRLILYLFIVVIVRKRFFPKAALEILLSSHIRIHLVTHLVQSGTHRGWGRVLIGRVSHAY